MKSLTLTPDAMPWLDRICRRGLFHTLSQLHSGCIRVCEGSNTLTFGNPQEKELTAAIIIRDSEAYRSIALNGSVGAGESYMTGDWDSDDLPRLIRILARNKDIVNRIDGGLASAGKALLKMFHALNRNTEKGSRRNIAAHYDLGNDMFSLFLDPTMMYSSAIFPSADATLEQASLHKMERICRKLALSESDHLLEIGSGWGSMAIYAASHYGCRVTTTTISAQQYEWAAQKIRAAGLQDKITLLKKDYRELDGQYDKLVSIEMIEAVGYQYLDTYIAVCNKLLKDDGLALIQAITIDDQRYQQAKKEVDFIKRYIFPGSFIPCISAICQSVAVRSDMKLVNLEDITPHYARTLALWRQRFLEQRQQIRTLGYDETFIRLWDFYFSYCEGGFAERVIGDVQLLFAKPLNRRPPLAAAV